MGKIQTKCRSNKEAKEVFKSSAREAGEELTDLQAEQAVTRVLKTARLQKVL